MTFAILLTAFLFADPEPTWKTATLDGQPIVGTLLEISPLELKLQTAEGPKSVPLARLLTMLPADRAPETPYDLKPAVWVEFVDGTRIPATSFESVKGKVKIAALDGKTLEPSVKSLAVVRFAETWDPAFVSGREGAGSDRLGVKKKTGIDFLEGIVGDVTNDVVNFTLDGDNLPVNRAKVDALVFVQKTTAELPDPLCTIELAGGAKYQVRTMTLAENGLVATTLSEQTLAVPLGGIKKWDFSAGKLQYLGDMTPESTLVAPFVAIPKELPILREYFAPRIDRGRDDPMLRLDGKSYAKGLALHSKTELVYRLPPKSGKFLALAGIDDSVGNEGNVLFKVIGDGKELYTSTFRGIDKAVPLEIDVTGVRKLTLIVDYGEDLDVGDYFDLADARIVK